MARPDSISADKDRDEINVLGSDQFAGRLCDRRPNGRHHNCTAKEATLKVFKCKRGAKKAGRFKFKQ